MDAASTRDREELDRPSEGVVGASESSSDVSSIASGTWRFSRSSSS